MNIASEPTPCIDGIQPVALLQKSARVSAGKSLELMDKKRLVIIACIQGQGCQAAGYRSKIICSLLLDWG